jgi:uncharacterized metal-binding protein
VTPASKVRLGHPRPRNRLGQGQVRTVIDAHHFLGGSSDHRDLFARRHRQCQQVGQVELALGVAILHLRQRGQQKRRVHGVDAGVDLTDRELRGRAVFVLDDPHDLATFANQPPIAVWICQRCTEQTQLAGRLGQQLLQARQRQQRRVTVQNEHPTPA